ncbi:MAG: hemolysin III family protein [Clostridiaceae bacterium]
MRKIFREPVSGLTHLLGALLSLVGLTILIVSSITRQNPSIITTIAYIIFGISLISLYCASSIYHLINASEKIINRLRRLDHSMIYILIAGTYTPICLFCLNNTWKITYLITIWSLALAGVLFKLIWFESPRWLSTAIYIIMGWLCIFVVVPLYRGLTPGGFYWLLLGGICYTVGGVIYGTKKPKLFKALGFHEIFHIFVLAGSFCHFWVVYKFIA